jgi:hypothetical protein
MFTAEALTIGNDSDGGFLIGFTPNERDNVRWRSNENKCKVIRLHGEECCPSTEVWSFTTVKSVIEPFVEKEAIEKLFALTNEIEFNGSHLKNRLPFDESLGFNNITEELYNQLVSALQ